MQLLIDFLPRRCCVGASAVQADRQRERPASDDADERWHVARRTPVR